jgi:hypothetical protein
VPPGTYNLKASIAGFKQFTQQGITIGAASTTNIDVSLEVGSTSETIEVHADAKHVESETYEMGTEVSPSLIDSLPLQVSGQVRNPVQFIRTHPGVHRKSAQFSKQSAFF